MIEKPDVFLEAEADNIAIGIVDDDSIFLLVESDSSQIELIYSRETWQRIIDTIGDFL